METKLQRKIELTSKDAKIEFTSLYHLFNVEMLMQCRKELNKKKTVGVDGVNKEMYEEYPMYL